VVTALSFNFLSRVYREDYLNTRHYPFASTEMDREPQFSPDGTKIVFTSARSGNSELWLCEAEGRCGLLAGFHFQWSRNVGSCVLTLLMGTRARLVPKSLS
jgi:hypothetical protein